MENDSNLAELFSADAEYWRDIQIISVPEAILLSLGIEPRTIHDLACQRDPDDETDRLSFGLQQYEYDKRMSALLNAIAAKTLTPVDTNDSRYSDHFSLIAFIAWAKGKRWVMPKWLSSLTASKLPPDLAEEIPQNTNPIKPAGTTSTAVDIETRYLTIKEVMKLTGLGRQTIYDAVKAGRFPKQIYPTGSRAARWDKDEVLKHLQSANMNSPKAKLATK